MNCSRLSVPIIEAVLTRILRDELAELARLFAERAVKLRKLLLRRGFDFLERVGRNSVGGLRRVANLAEYAFAISPYALRAEHDPPGQFKPFARNQFPSPRNSPETKEVDNNYFAAGILFINDLSLLRGRAMDLEIGRIAVGTRFKISALGALRCPELAGKVGIVVGLGHHNSGITVLFDGTRRPTCLHADYISPLSEQDAAETGRRVE